MMLDFESWWEKFEEDLYIKYIETGCYYDTDREDFDEQEYEEWVKKEEQKQDTTV